MKYWKNYKHKIIACSMTISLIVLMNFFLMFGSTKKALAVCETPASSIPALGVFIADTLAFYQSFLDGTSDFIQTDTQTAQDETEERVDEFDENVRQGFSDFWNNDLMPAWMSMTEQLNTAYVDQTRYEASKTDARRQVELQRAQKEREAESRKELTPSSEQACRLDSVQQHSAFMERTTREISNALSRDATVKGTAHFGTAQSFGPIASDAEKWEKHLTMYCDSSANGGNSVCTADAALENADISVGSSILWGERLSFNLLNDVQRQLVADVLENFIDQRPPEIIPTLTLENPNAMREFNLIRSNAARKQSVYTVMSKLLADRVTLPLGRESLEIRDIRIAAGIPTDIASTRPSRHEIMQALTREAVMRPDFALSIMDNPDVLLKDTIATKTLQLQQSNQMYKRMEELSVMLASEFASDVEEEEPISSAIGSAPSSN